MAHLSIVQKAHNRQISGNRKKKCHNRPDINKNKAWFQKLNIKKVRKQHYGSLKCLNTRSLTCIHKKTEISWFFKFFVEFQHIINNHLIDHMIIYYKRQVSNYRQKTQFQKKILCI